MRILFVGQLGRGQTSRMRMEALERLGHSVIPVDSSAAWAGCRQVSRRSQELVGRGPSITGLNEWIARLGRQREPELLWAEKQEYLYPEVLLGLQQTGTRLLHYTPDPYFSLTWKQTRLADACLPLYDFVVTTKSYEMDAYTARCRKVIYSPLGYSEADHRPLSPTDSGLRAAFRSDVSFVGGWEPRRQRLLSALSKAGHEIKIWGYSWEHVSDGRWTPRRYVRGRRLAGREPFRLARDPNLAARVQGGEIYGDAYSWSIAGSRISLGFLRSICPDQHTTRTFEIPACGSMLLADRTPEHEEFFREGVEADFFSDEDELIAKASFYLGNEAVRGRVASAGYERCRRSGYAYECRLRDILGQVAL